MEDAEHMEEPEFPFLAVDRCLGGSCAFRKSATRLRLQVIAGKPNCTRTLHYKRSSCLLPWCRQAAPSSWLMLFCCRVLQVNELQQARLLGPLVQRLQPFCGLRRCPWKPCAQPTLHGTSRRHLYAKARSKQSLADEFRQLQAQCHFDSSRLV